MARPTLLDLWKAYFENLLGKMALLTLQCEMNIKLSFNPNAHFDFQASVLHVMHSIYPPPNDITVAPQYVVHNIPEPSISEAQNLLVYKHTLPEE